MKLLLVARSLVVLLFWAQVAHAATAQTFVQSVHDMLAQPDVYLASTTPTEPLITRGNRLQGMYAGTADVIGAVTQAIAQAEHEVLLQVYEWDDNDEAAQAVYQAVVRRLDQALAQPKDPFVVRILVSRTWPQENALQQRDVRRLIATLQSMPAAAGHITVELASHRGSLLSILHSKTLVIDAAQGFVMTGNLNTHGGIAQDSFNMAVALQGPVVHTLRQDWLSARAVATVDAVTAPTTMAWDGQTLPIADPGQPGDLTAAVLTRRANWTPWTASDRNPQVQGIVGLLDNASAHVEILNPSLGARQVQDALVRAIVDRKVRVTALLSLNMNRSRDQRFFDGDNATHADKLYRRLLHTGGIQAADRLSVFWGAMDGHTPSPAYGPGNVHAKAINLDDNALVVGSTNLNWLSFNNSRELSVALMGENVGTTFRTQLFAQRLACAAPMQAEDLPVKHRRSADVVYQYLRERATAQTDTNLTDKLL